MRDGAGIESGSTIPLNIMKSFLIQLATFSAYSATSPTLMN